jgi:hypothetical protein
MDIIAERIRKQLEEDKKLEDICCPYCDKIQFVEDMRDYVTFWGEDESKKYCCESCDEIFYVKEHVVRTFECTKKGDVN